MRPRTLTYARWLLAALLAGLLCADLLFPLPQAQLEQRGVQSVLARDGTPLRAFPDARHVWRHPVRLEEVSPRYIDAVLAYEDRFFYWHFGTNPVALLRASGQWLRHGEIVSGGSTLSMQVARMLTPIPRSVTGKLLQIFRAVQLELHLSKREILELYLAYAPMGGVLEGVEAASRAYLGKPSLSLSHGEAALLAVLPQAPSRLRPDRYPQAAQAARDKVLQRLAAHWSERVIADARMEPVIAQAVREPLLAPLFAERMRRRHPGTPRIESTLDAAAQSLLEQLLAGRLAVLPPRVSLAALVVDNSSMEVRAYAGSADFSDNARFAHVDMVQARRSPGSTLKPFLYGMALDAGLIHSESLLADVPQSFDGYQPGNFQADFSGPVSVTEALRQSLNVPAVEVLSQLGAHNFTTALRAGGLKLDLPQGAEANLSVILGGAATSLEDLVGAYRALAAQGLAARPRYHASEPLQETRLLSPGAAFIIRDLLETGGPLGRHVDSSVASRRGLAWKTGTSFGFRDAWAIGVNDRYSIGVWVGRPDGTPNPGFFGANIAAPLLVDIFTALDLPAAVERRPPASVTAARICWPLGLRSSDTPPALCHQERTAWLLNAVAPPTFPDRLRPGPARQSIHIDARSGLRIRPDCHTGEAQPQLIARWPTALEPWLNSATRQRALPPAWSPTCGHDRSSSNQLKIFGLTPGEILHRSSAGSPPRLRLEARGGQGEQFWLVNGTQIGHSAAGKSFLHTFSSPGRYRVTVLDESGHYDSVDISVQ